MLKIWLIQGFILNLHLIIFIIWLIFMCKRFVCIFQMKQKNPESSKIKESKKWKYFNCFDYSFVYLLYFYLWRICQRGWKVQITKKKIKTLVSYPNEAKKKSKNQRNPNILIALIIWHFLGTKSIFSKYDLGFVLIIPLIIWCVSMCKGYVWVNEGKQKLLNQKIK